jgi:hypothetical protein
MDNSKSIDYNSKVLDFMAMTETGDPEIATKYLEATNWDETAAVNQFFSKIRVNNNFNNDNIMRDELNINNSNNNNILNRNLINNHNNNRNNNTDEDQGFISKYFLAPIRALLGACSEKREVDLEEEERIFHLLPNKINNSRKFCESIRRKIGIIIFYSGNNVQFLTRFINQLSRNTILINLLKTNFYIYPLLASTNEGYKMGNVISDNQLVNPSFVFCYNGSNLQRGDYIDIIFDRNYVINILEGEISLDTFNNALIDCIEKTGIQYNINNLSNLTDGEVLEQQKVDMENLEREAQKREEELKKQRLLEQQKKKEEELKMKEIESKANEAKKKIVEEPEEDDPNSTIICFRYPDGEKRKDRRFLKNHTIQNLYDYVTSLGKEIYTEEDNNSFSLYQPFPPKKYVEMDNTLEKEGLFPNAVIQIREE